MAKQNGNSSMIEEDVHIQTNTCRKKLCTFWRANTLLLITIAAVFLGMILGFALRPLDLSPNTMTWIKIWGELFMRMLKLIILPLLMSCLVVGVASMESTAGGKMGVITISYIFITQIVGVLIGIIMVLIVHPGTDFGGVKPDMDGDTSYSDVFADFLRNLIPDNIVKACIQQLYTERKTTEEEVLSLVNYSTNGVNGSYNATYESVTQMTSTSKLLYRDGMNTMGIITFSISLAFAISASGESGKMLLDLFTSLNNVIFKLMKAVIWYSPIGIVSLVCTAILQVKDEGTAFRSLGLYILTLTLGAIIHQFIFLPLLYLATIRKNPFKYYLYVLDGILAGVAPSSSAVSLPYLLSACTEKVNVDPRVAKFALPMCTMTNKDGSAMFVAIATVFVAQTYGVNLSADKIILLGLLATMLAAAVAAVPSSSIVVLMMTCVAIDVPLTERLGLLMAVEWIMDRIRTSCNIASNAYGCVIIDKYCHLSVSCSPSLCHGKAEPTSLIQGDDVVIECTPEKEPLQAANIEESDFQKIPV